MKPALITKNNAIAQLKTLASPSAVNLVLKTGEGDNLPQPVNGTTDDAGTSTTLELTDVGSLTVNGESIAVLDEIWNVTDGSHALVLAINTDSITTTPLKGGSDNTWANGDEFSVNPFAITLVEYATDGITENQREVVRIYKRSGDTLTADASGRGYDNTTALEWAPDSYLELRNPSILFETLKEKINYLRQLVEGAATLAGNKIFSGLVTFSQFPILPSSDPSSDYQPATKKYVDDNLSAGGISLLALENLTVNDFASYYGLASQALGQHTSYGHVGYSTSYSEKQAFAVFGSGVSNNQIKLNVMKNGGPTDNFVVRIETDSGGFPSGTLVDPSATASLAGTSITTSFAQYTFTFGGSFSIPVGTKCHVVCERSGALSTSNYFRVGMSGTLKGSITSTYTSSTWAFGGGASWSFIPYLESDLVLAKGVFKTPRREVDLAGYVGATVSAGSSATIIDVGVMPGFTGLKPGTPYLNNGQTLTAATSATIDGYAQSDTEFLFNRYLTL